MDTSDRGSVGAPDHPDSAQLIEPLGHPERETLVEDLRMLRSIVMQKQRIDLVQLGPLLTLMYVGDMSYKVLPDAAKNRSLFDLETHMVVAEPQDLQRYLDSWRVGTGDLLHLMLGAFGQIATPSFVDVGCQYGALSMNVALFARSVGLKARMHAFDCGVTRELAAYNFANNGFADEIVFHPVAVGGSERFVVVHRDVGQSEGNRIGGAIMSWERGTTDEVVPCTTLDRLLEDGAIGSPVVVKVDTEGAEPAVLRGAAKLMSGPPCAMMLEFSPSGFGAAVGEASPTDYLLRLLEGFHIFDVGRHHDIASPVEPLEVAGYAERIANSPAGWSDIVLLDRRSNVSEVIRARLMDGRG